MASAAELAAQVKKLEQEIDQERRDRAKAETQRDNISRVSAKLPSFWAEKPTVWFAQADAQFGICAITVDATKYQYVVSQLDTRIAAEVEDIITGPPAGRTYPNLKTALIDRLSMSEEKRVRKLLDDEEMGDRKPSAFLRHLRSLAGTSSAVSDALLKTLWLRRFPAQTAAILTSQPTLDLDALATLADKVIELEPAPVPAVLAIESGKNTARDIFSCFDELQKHVIAALPLQRTRGRSAGAGHPQNRARSGSRSIPRAQPAASATCWYHTRWGDKAQKCVSPCARAQRDQGNANGSQ